MDLIIHRIFNGWLTGLLLLLIVFSSSTPSVASPLPSPLTAADFPKQNEKQVQLGRLLFYDKILSGNKNISCGTCHHNSHFGGDGLSLGIGEGGRGVGPDRLAGDGSNRIKRRISRNAPALWNLGAKDIEVLFHDGRLSLSDDYDNSFNSPAEERLPDGLDGLLSAQALFPLTSRFEMAGDPQENSIARAAFDRIDHVWPLITSRIIGIPEYVNLFADAFEHIDSAADIIISDIVNALGAFETEEWQSFDSPFDQFLAGETAALNPLETQGLDLFYGEANCASCHSGRLLTDQKFHALGLPVFGPGRTRRYDPIPRDTGRLAESNLLEDNYRFRTPSLRNVELTGPYGHNGAYQTLRQIIEHHLNPAQSRENWEISLAALPDITGLNKTDLIVVHDKREMARYNAKLDIESQSLQTDQINALVAFLKSLTGSTARSTADNAPDTVPSGLPVDQKQ